MPVKNNKETPYRARDYQPRPSSFAKASADRQVAELTVRIRCFGGNEVGIVMLIMGFILAKLRVKMKLWFVLYITLAAVILAITINSYPSIEKAMSKNGSWWAYIFGSLNLGLYASVILSVIITLIVKLFEKKKIRSHKTEQA